MLYLDTCVLLALLTPEIYSQAATAFLEQAPETLAVSPWCVTELHSALALKVRSDALHASEADRVLAGFEQTLAPGLLWLDLDAQDFRNANACLRGWCTPLRGDLLGRSVMRSTLDGLPGTRDPSGTQQGGALQALLAGIAPLQTQGDHAGEVLGVISNTAEAA
jgi:uncharacterized protein with PIN domain